LARPLVAIGAPVGAYLAEALVRSTAVGEPFAGPGRARIG
jgi:hypothetical protein